jgi:hypothetical protein
VAEADLSGRDAHGLQLIESRVQEVNLARAVRSTRQLQSGFGKETAQRLGTSRHRFKYRKLPADLDRDSSGHGCDQHPDEKVFDLPPRGLFHLLITICG